MHCPASYKCLLSVVHTIRRGKILEWVNIGEYKPIHQFLIANNFFLESILTMHVAHLPIFHTPIGSEDSPCTHQWFSYLSKIFPCS